MALPILPEGLLSSLLPKRVMELDSRGLVSAFLDAFQVRHDDIRSIISQIDGIYSFLPMDGSSVIVEYADSRGKFVTRSVLAHDVASDTTYQGLVAGTVDLAQAKAWASALIDVPEETISNVTLGVDKFKVPLGQLMGYLAKTLGATLPTENDPAINARMLESHLLRMAIKGTPLSLELAIVLAGFDRATITPLWGRLSPRNPRDIASVENDLDFRAVPDIDPAVTPTATYQPTDFRDGPFYTWTADVAFFDVVDFGGQVSSPYINLKIGDLKATTFRGRFIASESYSVGQAVVLEDGKVYTMVTPTALPPPAEGWIEVVIPEATHLPLEGGTYGVTAKAALSESVTAEAIVPGDSFNGMVVWVTRPPYVLASITPEWTGSVTRLTGTLTSPHGLEVGKVTRAYLRNIEPAVYGGLVDITVTSSTAFSYEIAGLSTAVGEPVEFNEMATMTAAMGTLLPAVVLESVTAEWTGSETVLTATTATFHGFAIGTVVPVVISNINPDDYGGTIEATITGPTTFTYEIVGEMTVAGRPLIQMEADLGRITLQVRDRLSSIKYATNFFNVTMSVGLDSAEANGIPMTGGGLKVDGAWLATLAARAMTLVDESRPATRFARNVGQGLIMADDVTYAVYVHQVTIVEGTAALSGNVEGPAYPRKATAHLIQLNEDDIEMTGEVDDVDEDLVHFIADPTYGHVEFDLELDTGNFTAVRPLGFPEDVTLVVRWQVTDTSSIRIEPSLEEKAGDNTLGLARPEDEFDLVGTLGTSVHTFRDSYVFGRGLTWSDINPDVDQPLDTPTIIDANPLPAVIDQSGVAYQAVCHDHLTITRVPDPDYPSGSLKVAWTAIVGHVYVVRGGTEVISITEPLATVTAGSTVMTYFIAPTELYEFFAIYDETADEVVTSTISLGRPLIPGPNPLALVEMNDGGEHRSMIGYFSPSEGPPTLHIIGSVFGQVIVSPDTFFGFNLLDNLVSWIPFNSHPEDDLEVRDVVPANQALVVNNFLAGHRIWDGSRGWVTELTGGATLELEKDFGIEDAWTMAFWLKVGPPLGSGMAEFLSLGPVNMEINQSLATSVITVNHHVAGVKTEVVSLEIDQGVFTFIYVRCLGRAMDLVVGDGWYPGPGGDYDSMTDATLSVKAVTRVLTIQDFKLWSACKSAADLSHVKTVARPKVVVVTDPTPIPSFNGSDQWFLRVLDSGFVVPDIGIDSRRVTLASIAENDGRVATTTSETVGSGTLRRVMISHHDSMGRALDPSILKRVGLEGRKPPVFPYKLGEALVPIVASGQVVVSPKVGNYYGVNALWTTEDEVISVGPPYDVDGGEVSLLSHDYGGVWPAALHMNPIHDRIWMRGDADPMYEVTLGGTESTPVYVARSMARSLADSSTVENYLSEAETVVLDVPYLTGEAVSDRNSQPVLTVGTDGVVHSHPTQVGAYPHTPNYMYRHQFTVASFTETAGFLTIDSSTLVDGHPSLKHSGILSWSTEGLATSADLVDGFYRVTIVARNNGTVDWNFAGFDVETRVGVGDSKVSFPMVLVPDGSGSDPSGTVSHEFSVAGLPSGDWNVEVEWSGKLDDPVRGVGYELVIESIEVERLKTEVFRLDGMAITPIDVTDGTVAGNDLELLPVGAWVVNLTGEGEAGTRVHEAEVRGEIDSDPDALTTADLLTGLTDDRRSAIFLVDDHVARMEALTLDPSTVLADPVLPGVPTLSIVSVTYS